MCTVVLYRKYRTLNKAGNTVHCMMLGIKKIFYYVLYICNEGIPQYDQLCTVLYILYIYNTKRDHLLCRVWCAAQNIKRFQKKSQHVVFRGCQNHNIQYSKYGNNPRWTVCRTLERESVRTLCMKTPSWVGQGASPQAGIRSVSQLRTQEEARRESQ